MQFKLWDHVNAKLLLHYTLSDNLSDILGVPQKGVYFTNLSRE